jgi:hypothetical protein
MKLQLGENHAFLSLNVSSVYLYLLLEVRYVCIISLSTYLEVKTIGKLNTSVKISQANLLKERLNLISSLIFKIPISF